MIKPDELRDLLEVISASGWKRVSVVTDGFTLSVGDEPVAARPAEQASTAAAVAPPAPATVAPAAPAAASPAALEAPAAAPREASANDVEVRAASVGVAWRSPKPNDPHFVEVGSRVSKGDTLLIIEVMKLFTPIIAPVDGIVREIHVDNAAMVEHGTLLVTLEATGPDA